MTTREVNRSLPTTETPWLVRGAAATTGPLFVVLVLAGNTMTESVSESEDPLASFAAQSSSVAAQWGIALDLLAFAAFAVFAGYLFDVLRRRDAFNMAGAVSVIAATIVLSVKLGAKAAYIAGLTEHGSLSAEGALALEASNNAAFVLHWLPFSLFVGAAAVALHGAGLVGRFGLVAGLVLGLLGVAAAVLGIFDPAGAIPIPFLLSLVWTLVVGVKLAVFERAALRH